MTSQIFPGSGEVWMCDFNGYVKPEIVKRRRVIVVSPRNPGARVVLVVPVSTIAPHSPRSVHVRFPPNSYRCFGDVAHGRKPTFSLTSG